MLANLRAIYTVLHDIKLQGNKKDKLVNKRLKKMLISAYKHVPYYRDLMQKIGYDPSKDFKSIADLKKFPVTTKMDIKKYGTSLFLKNGTDIKNCYKISTSGSTGIPLEIYFSWMEQAFKIARWLRVLFLNGYSIRDRVMSLTTSARLNEGITVLQKFGLLRRLAVSYHIPFEKIADIFLKYKPHVLYGNRSHLELLANELIKQKIRLKNLKLVVVAAEMLRQHNRDLFRKAFGIEVIEAYGSMEMGIIAFETQARDGLHLCDDLTIIEFLDEKGRDAKPGETARVIVTDLLGTTMPFIRYEQGDLAEFALFQNSRGVYERRITRIMGRDEDKIILPDKTVRNFHIFYEVMDMFPQILQFRVIQKKVDLFYIYIAAKQDYFKEIEEIIINMLSNNFPAECVFKLLRVDSIPPDPGGKIRMFISELVRSKYC